MNDLADRIRYIKTDLLHYYVDACDNDKFPGYILDYVNNVINLVDEIEQLIERENNE